MQRITYIMLKMLMAVALWIAAAGCIVPLFTSCSSHDDVEEQTHAGARYIKLMLNTNAVPASRTDDDPNGGEEGDGREDGILNENKIHDVTLFLFDGSSTIDNIKRTDKVLFSFYFNHLELKDGKWEQIIEFDYDKTAHDFRTKPESFYAIVVANAGDLTTSYANNGSPFDNYGDLLDYHFETLYKTTSGGAVTATTPIADYDRFIMTSAEISPRLTFGSDPDGSEAHPYSTGTINVQRLTARIDINPNTGTNCEWKNATDADAIEYGTFGKKSGYQYTVMKPSTETPGTFDTTNDRFIMTDIYLTNAHSGGTWLAKRVAPSLTSSEVTFFGKETPTSGAATNWVQSYNQTGVSWPNKDLLMQSPMEGWNYFIAGYMEENTDQTNVTTLHIKGYYKKQKKDGSGNYIDEYSYEEKEYQYRIRHSDPTGKGTAADPMHFAIVRNNIYRIKIDKIVKSDLEHAAVVIYYKDPTTGNYIYQSIGIDKNVTEDEGGSSPKEPNDAPRRKNTPRKP